MSENKFNKTYYLVKALNNGLYKKYLDGDIVLQDIADEFNVSFQHVAAVIKENNIGNPSEEKRMYNDEERFLIKNDVENGLPIECIQHNYKIFENISDPMNVFNTMTRWVKAKQFNTEIPYITESKLNKIILDINIMKVIKSNNMLPKKSKKLLNDIANDFNVRYSKVSNINSYIRKNVDNLLPNKDDELVKVIIRNLDITNDINISKEGYNIAASKAAKKYNVDVNVIKRIVECKSYIEGSNINEYINERNNIKC